MRGGRHRAGIADREPAADVEGVERLQPGAKEREHREPAPHCLAPRVHGAQLGPDVEVDAPGADWSGRVQRRDRRGELGLGHAELGRCPPDRQPRLRLRGHVRVEPEQDVERRSSSLAEPRAFRQRRQRLELLLALDRHPAQGSAIGGRTHGGAEVSGRLADPLERDPVVGDPGACGGRPFTARHHVRAQLLRADPRHDGRHVVRLYRVRAEPGVGERVAELRRRRLQGPDRGHVGRRPEPSRGRSEGRRQPRSLGIRGRAHGRRQSWMTIPMTVEMSPRTTDATTAPTIVSAVIPPAGKPPTVNLIPAMLSADVGNEQQHRGVDDQSEQPQRHHRDREGQDLDHRLDERVDQAEQDRQHDQLDVVARERHHRSGQDVDQDRERDRGRRDPDDDSLHGSSSERWTITRLTGPGAHRPRSSQMDQARGSSICAPDAVRQPSLDPLVRRGFDAADRPEGPAVPGRFAPAARLPSPRRPARRPCRPRRACPGTTMPAGSVPPGARRRDSPTRRPRRASGG